MVLSGTNRTSSIASITNRPNGGGNKKAGLPSRVDGGSMWSQVALNGTSNNTYLLKFPLVSTVKVSRGVGIRFFR
tara:strand:- start:687 stop:911 length:225 start_codon:yes stop_codon:yes gene_type:complete